jgi:hypothetical protein
MKYEFELWAFNATINNISAMWWWWHLGQLVYPWTVVSVS